MIYDFDKYNLSKAKDIANKFGKATLTEMMFNIQQMSLVDKGDLLRSLKFSVRQKSGEVDKITFMYEWYGRFHENGASNVFGNPGQTLPEKPWRSSAINHNIDSLNKDFAEFYSALIIDEIEIDSVKMKM